MNVNDEELTHLIGLALGDLTYFSLKIVSVEPIGVRSFMMLTLNFEVNTEHFLNSERIHRDGLPFIKHLVTYKLSPYASDNGARLIDSGMYDQYGYDRAVLNYTRIAITYDDYSEFIRNLHDKLIAGPFDEQVESFLLENSSERTV